jgi:zinc transport system substrate-binding protein
MKKDRNTFKIIVYLLAAVLVISTAGCAAKNSPPSPVGDRAVSPEIYTTFYPLYDFTEKIAGDKVRVENVVPAGVEPHDFEPSPRDVAKIQSAKAFIFLSRTMEPWAKKLQGELEGKGVKVIEAGKNLIKGDDPHIWLDPVLAKEVSRRIFTALVEIDEKNKAYYEKNFERLAARFDDLDRKYRETLSGAKKKDVVTSHAVLGYLAERYGLNQIPITGLSPQEEPSPRKMAELAELCRQRGVKYVFFETLTGPKLSETLAREVGAGTLVLNPLEGLTPEEVKAGEDYFSIMEKNLVNLKKALSE